MAERILLIAPGLRDPFWTAEHDPRSYDNSEKRAAFRRFLDVTTQRAHARLGEAAAALDEAKVLPGAVITSAHLLAASLRWTPDRVVLFFVPDEDMNPRVAALQEILPSMVQNESLKVDVAALENTDAAQMNSVIRSFRESMRSADLGFLFEEDADIRIVMGPSTPALNIGLFMLPYEYFAGAKLYQALHPADVARGPRLDSVPKTYLKELPVGEEGLPHLSVEREAPAEIRRLRRERDVLQSKIDLLTAEGGRAVPPAESETAECATWSDLEEAQRAERRAFLERAIREEKRRAVEAGRAPQLTGLARAIGEKHQNTGNYLKRHGLEL